MGISLEDLLGGTSKDIKESIRAAVTLDVAVRLAIVVFGRTCEPEEIGPVFQSIREKIYSVELYAENREIVDPYLKELEDGVMDLSKTIRAKK